MIDYLNIHLNHQINKKALLKLKLLSKNHLHQLIITKINFKIKKKEIKN